MGRGLDEEGQISEAARSQVMRALTGQKTRYVIDWDSIYVEDEMYLNLDDPFRTYGREADEFIRECQRGPVEDF